MSRVLPLKTRIARNLGVLRSLAMYYGQPWRIRAMRRFIGELVRPGSLAFDIGAHAGNRTLALSKAGARVVAMEPQPAFQPILNWLASRRDITVRTEAVGRAAGRTSLRISSRHPTVSSTAENWPDEIGSAAGFEAVRWDDTIEVAVVTLDRLIADHGVPDFVKIDVEGSEAEVLAGLSQPLPLISFEYLPAAEAVTEHCFARLSELGTYEYNFVVGENQRFEEPEWLPLDALRPKLAAEAATGRSGDIYARLKAPEGG